MSKTIWTEAPCHNNTVCKVSLWNSHFLTPIHSKTYYWEHFLSYNAVYLSRCLWYKCLLFFTLPFEVKDKYVCHRMHHIRSHINNDNPTDNTFENIWYQRILINLTRLRCFLWWDHVAVIFLRQDHGLRSRRECVRKQELTSTSIFWTVHVSVDF